MNKKLRALVDQDILTIEEAIEYEELMICERFFSLVNQHIDIEIDNETKHYVYDKSRDKYRVRKLVDGKFVYYGRYDLEKDAKARVRELQQEGVL